MSPKSNRTSPYSRRTSTHPKSSRQQFSACGACRIRRVRCDLKDLAPSPGAPLACSNCRERRHKCIDEFAEIKTAKLLRRGRRLQQVEALYGKHSDDELSDSSVLGVSPLSPKSSSSIPQPQLEFFNSRFWRRLCMQRPILIDFPNRYLAHLKGPNPLPSEGRLLAMVLVAVAASFGVNEAGVELDLDQDSMSSAPASGSSSSAMSMRTRRQSERALVSGPAPINTRQPHDRSRVPRGRASKMVREILSHVDYLGLLRRPSWDSIRVLSLLLIIAEDVQTPLERATMQDAAFSHAYTLTSLAITSHSPLPSAISPEMESEIRTRVFWYAYVQESISTGLRGGRLVFDQDDLEAFRAALPSSPASAFVSSVTPPLPSPISPTFPGQKNSQPLHYPVSSQPPNQAPAYQHPHDSRCYDSAPWTTQDQTTNNLLNADLFSLPLHLSAICRHVHTLLTGPKGQRLTRERPPIDAEGMRHIWEGLDTCWHEFDTLRRNGAGGVMGVGSAEEIEQFVGGWQIFIFECHNLIRETLKHKAASYPSASSANGVPSPGHPHAAPAPSPTHSHRSHSPPSSYVSASTPLEAAFPANNCNYKQLHGIARKKCYSLLPHVLDIMKRNLSWTNSEPDGETGTGLFRWDTGLVRDGCFAAAFLVAGGDDPDQDGADLAERRFDPQDALNVCMQVLDEMRWAFSRTDERQRTLRMIWEDRQKRQRSTSRPKPPTLPSYAQHQNQHEASLEEEGAYVQQPRIYAEPAQVAPPFGTKIQLGHPLPLISDPDRPLLPPLAVLEAHNACAPAQTAPMWTAYTPPGTASTAPDSPSYASLASSMGGGGFKGEDFYLAQQDLDPFGYSPHQADPVGCSDPTNAGMYAHQHHRAAMHADGGYMDPGVVFAGADSSGEEGQYPAECHGYYH